MIKMIACDLDGTLLDSNHELTKANIEIVEVLKQRDIPFIIATGRIYPSAEEYSQALDLKTPIIACNGAVVKDPTSGEILFDYPVKTEIMLELVSICKNHNIYFHIYTIDTVYAERNERLIKQYNDWKLKDPSKSLVNTGIVEDIVPIIMDNTVYKLGIYIDDIGAKEAYEKIVKVTGITTCFSLDTLVDIFNENASKGVAVKELARRYNIDTKHVMSLGDNENDITMLEVAGIGVAMFDAREHVKAAANYIADTNDNSGVAKAIKAHLKI